MAYRFTPTKQSKLNELSAIDLSTPLSAKEIIGSVDGTSVGPVSVLSVLPAPDGEGAAATGSVISWNGTGWAITAGGSVSNVADLGDVAVNGDALAAGQVLKWDPTANDGVGAWVNGADVVGGAGPSVFADLADCSGVPDAAKSGYALTVQPIDPSDPSGGYCFKPAPLNFIPTNYPAYLITNTHVSNWNTAHLWGDHAAAGYATIGSLSAKQDLLGGGVDGDVLTWNGTSWGAAAAPDTRFTFTVTVNASNQLVVAENTIRLIEGQTYKFDQSDASNDNHPIAFSQTPNGTHLGGVVYATESFGTPGTPGAYTVLEVVSATPATLYYYCANHNGMADHNSKLDKLAQLPSAAASGSVLTWDGFQWNGAPPAGGGGAAIPDGTNTGDIPIWISSGSGGSWGIASAPDPRYVALESQCRTVTFASVADGTTIVENVVLENDIWLMCENSQGEPVSLVIPDLPDPDPTDPMGSISPKGRRLMISDILGLTEANEIVVSIGSPAGGTLGAIDSTVPGTSESVFDFASLTLVCTGKRTTPGDPTTGLIWKIV